MGWSMLQMKCYSRRLTAEVWSSRLTSIWHGWYCSSYGTNILEDRISQTECKGWIVSLCRDGQCVHWASDRQRWALSHRSFWRLPRTYNNKVIQGLNTGTRKVSCSLTNIAIPVKRSQYYLLSIVPIPPWTLLHLSICRHIPYPCRTLSSDQHQQGWAWNHAVLVHATYPALHGLIGTNRNLGQGNTWMQDEIILSRTNLKVPGSVTGRYVNHEDRRSVRISISGVLRCTINVIITKVSHILWW